MIGIVFFPPTVKSGAVYFKDLTDLYEGILPRIIQINSFVSYPSLG
jgi:hypothetical protein